MFGPKRLILYGAVINVVGTFLTPYMASEWEAIHVIALRFIMGFGQVSLLTFSGLEILMHRRHL